MELYRTERIMAGRRHIYPSLPNGLIPKVRAYSICLSFAHADVDPRKVFGSHNPIFPEGLSHLTFSGLTLFTLILQLMTQFFMLGLERRHPFLKGFQPLHEILQCKLQELFLMPFDMVLDKTVFLVFSHTFVIV